MTLSGFTRPSDPIDAAAMALKISTDIGKLVTVEIIPTDILVTGLTLVSGDSSAIQTSMNGYFYVPLQYPANSVMYADDDSTMVANSGTRIPTQRAIKAALTALSGSKTAVRIYFSGTAMNGTPQTGDMIIFVDTVTTVSGVATFYITNDHTATGTALCSSISVSSIDPEFTDSTGVYSKGVPTVATDKKSITVPITKQASTGVTILGIGVLQTLTLSGTPDGTSVNLFAIGVAA